MTLSKSTKVLIATFAPWKQGKRLPINGNVEPMLEFFSPRTCKTVLIDQVYPGGSIVMPILEVYEQGRYVGKRKSSWWLYLLYPFLKSTNTDGTHVSFKLRDFFSVLDIGLRERFDYFIGFEAINALGGILLKKLGRVKYVVYYVSDYSPNRYPQKWFNDLYLWLDRQAAMKADIIWDVSWAMQPARVKAGLNPKKSAPVIQVPNALYPKQIQQAAFKDVIPFSLVFMGTLGPENGPDLAIQTVPLLIKKFPKVTLHVIGGGDTNEARLKKLAKDLNLEKHIIFHGFIADREKVSATIRNFAIALAPYINISGSARLYGDATKIRAYLAAGLPTITTPVPPLGKDAAKKGAAIIVPDTPEDLAKAIDMIFSNKKLYNTMRDHAISFAQHNTWEYEYTKAFQFMENMKKK